MYLLRKFILLLFFVVCNLLFYLYSNPKLNSKYLTLVLDKKSIEFSSQNIRLTSYSVPKYDVNCNALFKNNSEEILRAKYMLQEISNVKRPPDSDYIIEESKCENFKKARGYYRHGTYASDFPLAITILAHESAEQLERLLRTLYQPQNIYCIHIDKKSDPNFHKAFESISKCFDNVFIATKTFDIIYTGHSRLEADFNCLKDLLTLDNLINTVKHPNLIGKKVVDWKYALNYVGTEFPTKTNSELVNILKMYNGANEIQVIENKFLHRYEYKWVEDYRRHKMKKTEEKNPPPPHGYILAKGFCSYAISRKFAEYAVFDPRALSLMDWLKNTKSSNEFYWSTLEYNTQIYSDHGFIQNFKQTKNTLVRYSAWSKAYNCTGKIRNGMCVFSIGDLSHVIKRREFLINKFMIDNDPISYQCMEEWFDKNERTNSTLDLDFYCNFARKKSNLVKCKNI
ncbi:unnamed protein product [Brachionus calyciflorus]|uniref:Uncharacterized protein n=1 Tax=Brachionus calyciflorus TaxID=104777 RepID=A0A813QPT7_9BILA|nr:unnamed protein product [Brachionus calyciflorus]